MIAGGFFKFIYKFSSANTQVRRRARVWRRGVRWRHTHTAVAAAHLRTHAQTLSLAVSMFQSNHTSSVAGGKLARVQPSVVFAIVDHYCRRPEGQLRVIGTLLGSDTERGVLGEGRAVPPPPRTPHRSHFMRAAVCVRGGWVCVVCASCGGVFELLMCCLSSSSIAACEWLAAATAVAVAAADAGGERCSGGAAGGRRRSRAPSSHSPSHIAFARCVVSECFPVPHTEGENVAVDMTFHRNLFELHLKANPTLHIVGCV